MTRRQPVVDCWALNPDNLGEYLSLEHCRVAIERVCPRKGDVMVTNRRRPILKIMEDTENEKVSVPLYAMAILRRFGDASILDCRGACR